MEGNLLFEYDELGRLTRVLDLERQTEISYDYALGLLAPDAADCLEECADPGVTADPEASTREEQEGAGSQ